MTPAAADLIIDAYCVGQPIDMALRASLRLMLRHTAENSFADGQRDGFKNAMAGFERARLACLTTEANRQAV